MSSFKEKHSTSLNNENTIKPPINSNIQHDNFTKVLSLRNSKIVPTKVSIDETVNVSIITTELIDTELKSKSFDKEKLSHPIFEPLDEEGERYLQEHMCLPPIDLEIMPTQYYINPHPTESIMSSSANSANEWWDKVDYSDEEVHELECAREGRNIKRIHKRTLIENSEEAADNVEFNTAKRTFPRTLEAQKERQTRDLQKEEASRAEIISKLEKKMVSLFNLKTQYQRTLRGEGCQRTTLPPLVASDKLTRQRDSLISRIKRKKLEDEVRRKKQIERKINIVKTLLNEQKLKEKEIQKKLKDRKQFTYSKQKKTVEEESTILSTESVGKSLDIVDAISAEGPKTEEITSGAGLVESGIERQLSLDDVPQSMDDHRETQIQDASSKKSSKIKNKKLEKAPKKDGKSNKKKAKKDKDDIDETPAICEPTPELPSSQMAELSLWFENWRENIREQNWCQRYYEDQRLLDESEVMLKPSKIVFKDVVPGQWAQQVVVMTNVGREALQCRVLGVQQSSITEISPNIQTTLSGPSKARTGQFWSLTVAIDPLEGVDDGSAEVMILFSRGEVKTKLSVEVQVLTPRSEPILRSTNIKFGSQMFWCSNPVTKYLKISNSGSLSSQVYWAEVVERINPLGGTSSSPLFNTEVTSVKSDTSKSEASVEESERIMTKDMAKDIVKTIFNDVFKVFRIDARQPLTLPPKSDVLLPVRFIPSLCEDRGSIFSLYRIYFEGEKVKKDIQDLIVSGTVERSPFWLEPEVLNMKLCYTGGTVQQGRLLLYSSVRHACQVVVRVPRSLASVVSVTPRSFMVAAKSCVHLCVRVVLGWDFLETPCRYIERDHVLLMFPLSVRVTDMEAPGAPPLEATVIASVSPPCPLTLEPPEVILGTVSTMETVQVELNLRNHCPRTYNYAFVDLPKSITIEPGSGTGSILPLETVKLTMLFSPSAKDLGVDCERPGNEGEVNFTLKCFTTVSLASPIGTKQPLEENFAQQKLLPNNSRISSKYTVGRTTSLLSLKKVSQRESMQYFVEGYKHNKSDRKVQFQESNEHDFSEKSFVYIPAADEEDREELGEDEVEGEEVEEDVDKTEVGGEEFDSKEAYEEDYVTIGEVKEDDVSDTEELWDYYATYKFGKCSKEDRTVSNQIDSEKEIERVEENEADMSESKPRSTEDGVNNYIKDIDTDKAIHTKSITENELHDYTKEKSETTIESVSESNDRKNGNTGDILADNVIVEEVETDDDENVSHDTGAENEGINVNESKEVCLLPNTSQRFAAISIKAYVIDPLVELSPQAVVFPPTPCSSFSIAHIYLRSRPQKSCGVHHRITKFKTRFEFRSPSTDLTVDPKRGYVTYKQGKKINLIFSPNLSKKEIYDKALEMKVDNLKWQKLQDMLNDYNKAMEKKKPKVISNIEMTEEPLNQEKKKINKKSRDSDVKSKKGKDKKSKGSVASSVKTKKTKASLKISKYKTKSSGPFPEVVINPAEVEVMDKDLTEAKMALLKYLEPYSKTLTVTCLLQTDIGDGNRRQETLRCEVTCNVVAPTIFLGTAACLDFGPVAVGTYLKKEAIITNISFFDAFVRLSTLNPFGPFICPAHLEYPFWKNGELELPPEHIITIPLRFQPTESGEFVEAFEVISSLTVLHLQARGRGVPLSYSFLPDHEVFVVTSGSGKKADITISISNTCEAPLRFRISQKYLKEGQSLPTPKPEDPSSASSPKQKKDPKKEKKGKGSPEFTMLNEELGNCLEKDFANVENESSAEPVFKIMNADENITVSSGETKPIVIRFTPPSVKQEIIDSRKSPKSDKGSLKHGREDIKKAKNKKTGGIKEESLSTKSEKKNEVKTKRIFAARYSVIFSETQKVKDWIFIGMTK